MRVGAIAKDIGIPPRKVKLVVDMVRGKKVEDALNILKFTPTPAAKAATKHGASSCRIVPPETDEGTLVASVRLVVPPPLRIVVANSWFCAEPGGVVGTYAGAKKPRP